MKKLLKWPSILCCVGRCESKMFAVLNADTVTCAFFKLVPVSSYAVLKLRNSLTNLHKTINVKYSLFT